MKAELIDRLNNLLPELEHGKETHRQWRDCDQKYRDENPDIGDKDFHTNLVKVYENRISCVTDALEYIKNN